MDYKILTYPDKELKKVSSEVDKIDEEHDEGCLSVPGFYGKVNDRRRYIKVQYLDLKEQMQEVEFDNFLSVVIQHEIDHLNGILFVDRINFVEKLRFKKFLKENK